MTDLLAPEVDRGAPVDERLVCVAVEDVTHDVRSFTFERADGSAVAFEPGQYLTFTVEVDGVEHQRCYTIASSPAHAHRPTITVKRTPDGPVSGWLHDRFGVGDSLTATGPHGRFSSVQHPAEKYLFLSAGSGITPLMSMTRALHGSAGPADVVFVHSARSPRDIIFRDELEVVAGTPGFEVTVVCETADDEWAGATGLLGLRTLLRVAPDLHEREVFTCGPPAYMTAVREALNLAGVDPERCHEESFDLAARGAEHAVAAAPSGPTYAVTFGRSGLTVPCGESETLLDAALRAGLRPPSMCREGICGTCRTSLVEGQVDLRHAGGIRDRDVEQGEILLCCSRPCGDLVVDG
ncbi:2Fe-2S iron-sulfur cluster-binding protein [Nocardioides sp. GXQ0305]|uniref:2Fe-2S iron-sulfur cluster-binding protein n=1 Tax=Nocardioides sp. GXQ0305 TaxID=3423912 RepID=UPI003D7E4A87